MRYKKWAYALAFMALAATGWWAWQARNNPDTTAQDVSDQPFAFSTCQAKLYDNSPAIALVFTRALDKQQDFGKLIDVTESAAEQDEKQSKAVDARWVLGDNPRVLYLPYVKPERKFHIRIHEGLQARQGDKLSSPHECSLVSEGMPESHFFASRGTVLPAELNGGLPVVTVNTPEVDVQFLRVKPEQLSAFLDQVQGRARASAIDGESGSAEDPMDEDYERYGDPMDSPQRRLKGQVSSYVLDELRKMTDSVFIGRFATDARPNRRNVSFLPVEGIKELKEPGIYVAVMNAAGRFGWDYQVTHFYVTDIGLHVRRHPSQLSVFTTSFKSGSALSGIELALLDEAGKTLARKETDRQGMAEFDTRLDLARLVMARKGKEMSILSLADAALDLSEFDAIGHPSRPNKIFAYAGRDLYRPGENLDLSVLARDMDGRAWSKSLPLTLSVRKPDGSNASTVLVRSSQPAQGYYQTKIALPANAPTGRWMAQIRVDPASRLPDAQWAFQVEEFMPERMKLQLKTPEGALSGDAVMNIDVQGDYLYGAPAAGNTLQASFHAQRQINPLARQWPGFLFGDDSDNSIRKRQDGQEMTLDAQGRGHLGFEADNSEWHSPMVLRVSASLLESGGRPVVRSVERTWWPAPQLVAIRPLFDRNVAPENSRAEFEVIRVNSKGQFIAAKELTYRLIREDRQWFWRYDDSRGWHSGFNTQEEVIESRPFQLDRRSSVRVPVDWGRYRLEIEDPATAMTLRYHFYAGWGAQDADDIGNRPDRVQVKLVGAPYKPGQKARIEILPPHDGQAVVTIEGDRVLWRDRISVSAKGTTLDIPLSEEWKRHDLYFTVTAFRPGNQGDKVTPARALGLVHLPMWADDRKIKLDMTLPQKVTPEQQLQVKVKAAALAGQKAIVTVSAVDAGILNITNYPTPDPFDFFFGKHRYEADLLDIYGRLIERMEGQPAKQRFGGDAAKRDTRSLPRKVLLTDVFSGPVELDSRGEATVNLPLPDFNGTLRVMAVVSSAQSYGSTEAETVVAAPLVAELSTPRFLSPGDKASLALDLTNLSGSTQDVTVQIRSDSRLRVVSPDAPVRLADKQRKVLTIPVEAMEAWGLVPIKLLVQAGPLRIQREVALQLQPLTPPVQEVKRLKLEPGAATALDTGLLDGYWPGSANVTLSMSDKPPINIREHVQGLLGYPYGCLEQTTSSAYPIAMIDESSAQALGLPRLTHEERAKRLDVAFGRLAAMQQSRGGFGLWDSTSAYEGWLSAYVVGFLQDAKEAGFAPPESMLKRGQDHLLEQLQRSPGLQILLPKDLARDEKGLLTDRRQIEQIRQAHLRFAEASHAAYVMAKAQRAPLATLRTLHDQYRGNTLSPLPLVHLGLALKLMGDDRRATESLTQATRQAYGLPYKSEYSGYGDWLGDYGSRTRDLALSYALLSRHGLMPETRDKLFFELASHFNKQSYFSTQERLALVLAVRDSHAAGQAGQWQASLQQGTSAPVTLQADKQTAQRDVSTAMLKAGVSLKNEGKRPIFVEVLTQGYPLRAASSESPSGSSLVIERTLFNPAGNIVTARQFNTGDLLIVRLRVRSSTPVKDGLIVDRLPAGFEIENLNLSQGPQAGQFTVDGQNIAEANASRRIVHTEYRDDRFVAALQIDHRTQDVFYLVRAVTPGTFQVPAPFVEDMYRPELHTIGKSEAPITVSGKR